MVTEKGLVIVEDRIVAIQELETRFAMAIRQRELLEDYIKDRLKAGKHYYSFGESGQKPSLTKEGAELICLPHNLKPKYEILSGPAAPPLDNTPYQIVVRCSLWRSDLSEGEGLGSASSHKTNKAGESNPRQNDPGLCHNATLKMASKSAYIAATLNSTAASEFFTQDLEDDETGNKETKKQKEHFCEAHGVPFFKKGKMQGYAHQLEGGGWHNEPFPEKPPKATTSMLETQQNSGTETQTGSEALETGEGAVTALNEGDTTGKNEGKGFKSGQQFMMAAREELGVSTEEVGKYPAVIALFNKKDYEGAWLKLVQLLQLK